MTHYYHYIAADGSVDENTKFYSVGVDTGKQANRDYLFLIAYAAEHNHYFELYSVESTRFVGEVKKSLEPIIFCTMKISARDLVRAFKSGERPGASFDSKKSLHMNLMQMDANYRLFCNLSKRNFPHP